MSKLCRPGRNNPIEMSFVIFPERMVRSRLVRSCLEPMPCSRRHQQALAFQGAALATSNPPGGCATRMDFPKIFLRKLARCLRLQPDLDRAADSLGLCWNVRLFAARAKHPLRADYLHQSFVRAKPSLYSIRWPRLLSSIGHLAFPSRSLRQGFTFRLSPLVHSWTRPMTFGTRPRRVGQRGRCLPGDEATLITGYGRQNGSETSVR